MTAHAKASDVIFLAEARAAPVSINLIEVLERLGLSSGAQPGDSGTIKIKFAETLFSVSYGTDAVAWLHGAGGPGPMRAIGAVATSDPEPSRLVALRGEAAAGDTTGRLQRVQQLCVVAAMIGEACKAERVYWPPAGLWSPVSAFADAIIALEGEGLPPVLHLVAFADGPDGLQTCGLAHFCGVELQLRQTTAAPMEAAVRRLARLAIHAMVVGPPQPGAVIAGLEPREQLTVGGAMDVDGVTVIPVRMSAR